jgi:hypothetical protein
VDHRRYYKDGELIFGKETFADVRLVCGRHNGRGVRSDWIIHEDAKAGLWIGTIDGAFSLLGCVARWSVSMAARITRRAMR